MIEFRSGLYVNVDHIVSMEVFNDAEKYIILIRLANGEQISNSYDTEKDLLKHKMTFTMKISELKGRKENKIMQEVNSTRKKMLAILAVIVLALSAAFYVFFSDGQEVADQADGLSMFMAEIERDTIVIYIAGSILFALSFSLYVYGEFYEYKKCKEKSTKRRKSAT